MAQVAQLVELSVFGDKIERDIIVSGNIPLFQLHRVLQFCIKNRQSDDTIAAQVRAMLRTLLLCTDQQLLTRAHTRASVRPTCARTEKQHSNH